MPRDFNLNLRHGAFRTKWSPEKLRVALEMRANGATYMEIGKVIGLSHVSVSIELANAPCPRKASERRMDNARTTEASRAPNTVLIERERRAEAADRRNYTQTFFGDPPPGFSALDQKRAGA